MWSAAWRVGLVVIAAGLLASCGRPDAYSSMPEFIRLSKPEPRLPDPEPHIPSLLQANHYSVFTQSSNPKNVMVAKPRRDSLSSGWTFCIKADVNAIDRASMGTQTYLVYIERGNIGRRRPAEPSAA
jgi:hypothetical protein